MAVSERKTKRIRSTPAVKRRAVTKRAGIQRVRLTPEERDLLHRPAEGSWSADIVRATRDGGNFTREPDEDILRRQARRRELAKAGRPVLRVTLPEPKLALTVERKAQLERIDRLRRSIGKVSFSTAELIREMRDGGGDIRR